ncbi:dUTPase [Rhizocola hellebori]|uniref:dUTPase n=1 Tax=Rhizocola hellebori TaxID=1392758 RepID=A0A8J3Q4F3_9ACTN|nr:DUF4193 family protein [Rhizocola hellebori]GIH03599.1 dUTPase [Rhizocola hellebori]
MAANTDYDARRTVIVEPETESLDLLQERRATPADDLASTEFADGYELPGFDILDEELTTQVIPMRADEFRCGSCFLVLHRSLYATVRKGQDTCRDCA